MQTPVWVHFNVPDLSFAGINKRNLVKIEMNLEDQHSPTWNSFGKETCMIFGMKYFEFVFWHLLTSIVLWCTCVLRTIAEPHSKVEQTRQQNMSVGNHGSKTLRGNMRRNYNHLDACSPSNPPTLFTHERQLLRILYVTTSQWTNLTENHEHGHSPQVTVLQICGIGHCGFTGYKMD